FGMERTVCQARTARRNSFVAGMRELPRMRRTLKRVLGISALAAIGYALWRVVERAQGDRSVTWEPQAFPFPPRPREVVWVEPDEGSCPASHPVKVKVASGIFHAPGGANYARTKPDRCYTTAAAAE